MKIGWRWAGLRGRRFLVLEARFKSYFQRNARNFGVQRHDLIKTNDGRPRAATRTDENRMAVGWAESSTLFGAGSPFQKLFSEERADHVSVFLDRPLRRRKGIQRPGRGPLVDQDRPLE